MTFKIRNTAAYCRAAFFAALGFVVVLNSAFSETRQTVEPGIPVTDALVKTKCGSCHTSDVRGNMQRISWERATPEAWQRALQRMVLLDDVELTPAEAAHILQYLSTNHGLAPDEAKAVIYDVERRIHEETAIPEPVTRACGRCHNFARVLYWRRSSADWKELLQSHALRYNVRSDEQALALLQKIAPLSSPEWTSWRADGVAKDVDGRWLITASVLGRIRYVGEMEMESAGVDGEFKTRSTLRSVAGGPSIIRIGRGTMYGHYAWRGFSQADKITDSQPADLFNAAREVATATPDHSSAEGRWFWGQYQELGYDIKLRRATSGTTLLGSDRPLLKTGSKSSRIRLYGDHFPDQISMRDFAFGRGVTIRRIVSHTSTDVLAEVEVAVDAPLGRRQIIFRGSTLTDGFAVYDRVDYIKVTPESAMAAFGNQDRSRGYQQFEAIGYQKGADGKRHTSDDIELGPVEAAWSIRVFYESEGARKDSIGSVNAMGLFTPAATSPNTNFDVWVIAEARAHTDNDGKPLIGKSYLVVTVPVYTFNGRRYVRDLDRWVDDGPARPGQ
jgi:quinohemoprotein amine dehydrogenase